MDRWEPQYLRDAPGILPCRACVCDSSTLRTCWHVSSTEQRIKQNTLLNNGSTPTLAISRGPGNRVRVAPDPRAALRKLCGLEH